MPTTIYIHESYTTASASVVRPTLQKEEGSVSASPLIRESVSELQSLLQGKGYNVKVTAFFDAATLLAVRDFQRKRGLHDDGIVDSNTWAMLLVHERPVLRLYDGYDRVTPHLRMAVRELQSALTQKGLPISIDGRFGIETQQLVKEFQSRVKLQPDGIVGRETYSRLFDVALIQTHYKDHPRMMETDIEPVLKIEPSGGWKLARIELAECYNRLGGVMQALSEVLEIPAEVILTLYVVEAGGRTHTPEKALIRFENYLFYQNWGRFNSALYDRHFQHGGHAGVGGEVWQYHRFRERMHEPFQNVHTNQESEYRVLSLAQRLSNDEEEGWLALSIGTLQFYMGTYLTLGYPNAQRMYEAFQSSETAQLIALFDFCRHVKAPDIGAMLQYIRQQDWQQFARAYNGRRFGDHYAKQIAIYLEEAKQLGI
jgi:hypothetical protein